MTDPLVALQDRLGYQFKDPQLLRTALTHRSRSRSNYERLEFLGDSVLSLIVAEWLYGRFPDLDEGRLSRMRSEVVRRESLAALARRLGLTESLMLGEGELKSGGFNRDSILSDAMEGVIGAIYRDGGFEPVRATILQHLTPVLVELHPEQAYKDPKSRLQEHLQGLGRPVPVYTIVHIQGEPHQQVFDVACSVEGMEEAFTGTGTSRRAAEQEAARKAYQALLVP